MFFESDPKRITGNVESEDLIRMDPVTQRVLNYPTGKALPYINRDGLGELYGAIYLYPGPLTISISGENKEAGWIIQSKQPVKFTLTLRYQNTF